MIFCVEDDSGIRNMMLYALTAAGFSAEGFSDGAELFDALRTRTPQLILLDIMLPGMDGIEILKCLRKQTATSELPIIMATAKGTEYDRVIGLDLGADDYLAKPFGMLEMVSRVRAVLRRTLGKQSTVLRVGTLVLDPSSHTVTSDGARVNLTLKEYELLRTLMEHPSMVYTRDQLLAAVWNTDYGGETRTVDVHVRTLRAKLGACGNQIETVRGVGYRIEMET